MKTQLAMWGNSLAVRIPRALAEELSLMKGVEVDLQVEDGRLVVVPTRRPRYELCDLVREITDENRHPQLDWGEARGGGVVSGSDYIPDRCDLVWLHFSPQSGHEQAGRRPALVLSRKAYNEPSGLALFCPITSRQKGYPFEVPLPTGGPVAGVVLADQVRCLDWRARRADLICTAEASLVEEVVARVEALIR